MAKISKRPPDLNKLSFKRSTILPIYYLYFKEEEGSSGQPGGIAGKSNDHKKTTRTAKIALSKERRRCLFAKPLTAFALAVNTRGLAGLGQTFFPTSKYT